jgi:hypothetical protein
MVRVDGKSQEMILKKKDQNLYPDLTYEGE